MPRIKANLDEPFNIHHYMHGKASCLLDDYGITRLPGQKRDLLCIPRVELVVKGTSEQDAYQIRGEKHSRNICPELSDNKILQIGN